MNIIVLGDVMIDINYFSKIERFAPESSKVPIHNITNITYTLGGASNVANNLNQLDTRVKLISVVGRDSYGDKILELLKENSISSKIFKDDRHTTQKHRIFNNNELNSRYDIEDTGDISKNLCDTILDYIYKIEEDEHIDAIVISDYAKGVVSKYLCKEIISYSNTKNIYTFVDPKIKNIDKYSNCFCIKPNIKEAEQMTGSTDNPDIFERLKELVQCDHIVITASENGMYVDSIHNHITHINRHEVIDVTGAGDISLAVLVYLFLKDKNLIDACKIANIIAGKSTLVLGNYLLTNTEIEKLYLSNSIMNDKILFDYEEEKLKYFRDKNVIFTNGCFDIVHSAHLKLLNFCKQKGDILVVGINSDDSVKSLKGVNRPINNITERTDFLLNLNMIDYIVVFNDNTPYTIIDLIRPYCIIKGGDYKREDIVGAELAKEVYIFDYISNKSTSLVINKILNSLDST